MKKRLLSAALALAMVLTMLPLSVMPAFAAGTEGSDAYYHVKGSAFANADASNSTTAGDATGWYQRTPVLNSNGKASGKYTYTALSSGIVASVATNNGAVGKWYSVPGVTYEVNGKATTVKPGAFTLLGDVSIESLDWSLTNVQLNKHTLTISALAQTTGAKNARVTSYTITASGTAKNDGSALVLPSTITGRTLTLKATNANVNGFTMSNEEATVNGKTTVYYGGGTVTLTNCTLSGDITMPKGTLTLTRTPSTSVITMGTSASGQGGTVTLDEGSSASSVALYGPSTLNIRDTSDAGTVTVFGGGKRDVPANVGKDAAQWVSPNWKGATINLSQSGKATSIGHAGTSNISTDTADLTRHTIKAESNAAAGDITLNYADVTLIGAGAGTVQVAVGSVNLSASATADAITLGDSGKTYVGKCTLDINGDNTTVSAVNTTAVAASNLTVRISGGKFTGAVSLGSTYAGGGITGGTFAQKIARAAWLSNVTYEIKWASTNTYTYTDSFEKAVSAYTDTASLPEASQNEIAIVGSSAPVTIKFELNAETAGSDSTIAFALKADANTRILLPTVIGKRSVTKWYVGNTPLTAGEYYPVTTGVTLKATSVEVDLGTINGVTAVVKPDGVKSPNLTATLAGNTIKLSGAVDMGSKNYAPIELVFTTTTSTAADKANLTVTATYYDSNPKAVLFTSAAGANLEVSNDYKEVGLKGSNTKFTVDCSGLRKLESVVEDTVASEQAITVTAPGLGAVERQNLIDALKTSTFAYAGTSPALNQAMNKVLASYTASTVSSAIANGRRIYAQKTYGKTDATTLAQSDVMAYNTLKIQVYLDIKVTNLVRNGANTDGSITLDITPMYREMLYNSAGKYIVVSTGRALDSGLLKSTDGTCEIGIALPSADPLIFSSSELWAHHGDYVYKLEGDTKFTVLHGFSSFTINAVGPVAEVDQIVRNGAVVGTKGTAGYYYDTLAAAVADVAHGGTVKVSSGYSGVTSIPVSGTARQFTVDNSSNAGTALTFTGANVTSNNSSNLYIVELTRDSVAVTPTDTTISLGTYSNGAASLSVTSAKAGSTVTVTVTANTGYRASAPTVRTDKGKTVAVTTNSNGTYSFTVPEDATSITVTPTFTVDTGLPYTDVAANAWYFDAVKYCYTHEAGGQRLMQGYNSAGTTFGPNNTLTRAEVVTILWRLSNCPKVTLGYGFSDVKSGDWHYDAIAWASSVGIAKGYGDGTFQPNRAVSRQEMAVFIWRYQGSRIVNSSLAAYMDRDNVADWAVDAMRWITAANVLSGTNSVALGNRLDAYALAYRCQVAVTFERYCISFHNMV